MKRIEHEVISKLIFWYGDTYRRMLKNNEYTGGYPHSRTHEIKEYLIYLINDILRVTSGDKPVLDGMDRHSREEFSLWYGDNSKEVEEVFNES